MLFLHPGSHSWASAKFVFLRKKCLKLPDLNTDIVAQLRYRYEHQSSYPSLVSCRIVSYPLGTDSIDRLDARDKYIIIRYVNKIFTSSQIEFWTEWMNFNFEIFESIIIKRDCRKYWQYITYALTYNIYIYRYPYAILLKLCTQILF